mmetsp:Transcript_155369/g.496756  ORF Transcript_155369/g.496756 Transcript_155369/m.496756 type:complete len:142 (-) Transcript_155369:2377-2802(-)
MSAPPRSRPYRRALYTSLSARKQNVAPGEPGKLFGRLICDDCRSTSEMWGGGDGANLKQVASSGGSGVGSLSSAVGSEQSWPPVPKASSDEVPDTLAQVLSRSQESAIVLEVRGPRPAVPPCPSVTRKVKAAEGLRGFGLR